MWNSDIDIRVTPLQDLDVVRARVDKWAKEAGDLLKEIFPDLEYYADNEIIWQLTESEKTSFANLYKKYIKPDLFYNNKVIEFNGDTFHANPLIYGKHDTPNPFDKNQTAQDIWDKDNEKISYYKNKGYDILVIWESDWKKNKNKVIEECKTFLMK